MAACCGFHPLPFQRSSIGTMCPLCASSPTARHEFALVHETSARKPPLWPFSSGVVWRCQLLPSHRSANAPPLKRATASHAPAEAHDTALNSMPDLPVGFGACLSAQLLPFHCSASRRILLPVTEKPTAVHALAAGQETPSRKLLDAPAGFGVFFMTQLVPFQRAAKVTRCPLVDRSPTAMQKELVLHDTLSRLVRNCLGVICDVQVLPSQVSENDPFDVVVENEPTARQEFGDVQDTEFRLVAVTPKNGCGDAFCQRSEKSSASARLPSTGSW